MDQVVGIQLTCDERQKSRNYDMSGPVDNEATSKLQGPTQTPPISPGRSDTRASGRTDDCQSQGRSFSPKLARDRISDRSHAVDEDISASKPKFVAPVVRTASRWADEVEEDDQFLPIKPSFTPRERPPKVRESVTRTPPQLARRPTPATTSTAGRPIEIVRRTARPLPPLREKGPVQKGPSAAELEELAHMNEIMAKKAEERKRQKVEEEARLEAERKARCAAKLKEIEERQRSRTHCGIDSKASSPEPQHVMVNEAVREPKRAAFNQARSEVRHQREESRQKEGIDTSLIVQPPAMSAHAQEFVPQPHQMMHPQWIPHHSHYGYHPEAAPAQFGGYYPYPPQAYGYMRGGPYY